MSRLSRVGACVCAAFVLSSSAASAATTAYVAAYSSSFVTPIDVETGVARPAILAGSSAQSLATSSDGRTVYGGFNGRVVALDVAGGVATRDFHGVGNDLRQIAVAPDGKTVYVADWQSNAVQVVDVAAGTLSTPIVVPAGPHGLVLSPDGRTLYVGSWHTSVITPIDTATRTLGTAIAVGARPRGLALTPDGKTLLVAENGARSVSMIDTATGTKGLAIPMGGSPEAIALTPDGRTAYVALPNADAVVPIDVHTSLTRSAIGVGAWPTGLAVSPDGSALYVTSYKDDSVTPVDVATGEARRAIAVGPSPTGVTFSDTAVEATLFGARGGRLVGAVGGENRPGEVVARDLAGDVTVEAVATSNAAVAPLSAIQVGGSGVERRVTIAPARAGEAEITLRATAPGGRTSTATLRYAASVAVPTATTRYHEGLSDASAAIDVGDGHMLVANDEDNVLRLFRRGADGPPVRSFNFGSALGDPAEIDIETVARSGDRLYWTGSLGNNKSGQRRAERQIVFTTVIRGSGDDIQLSFGGYYRGLRDDLVAWDRANGDRFKFSTITGNGRVPKRVDGFNVEGLEFAPGDGSTAYLGFRAPLVPAMAGGEALLIPVTNIDEIAASGLNTTVNATFGEPILMDLGGLSIRDLRRNADGAYLILAGSWNEGGDQVLYTWDGVPAHAPVRTGTVLPIVNDGTEEPGAFEAIVDVPHPLTSGATVELVMDNGTADLYANGVTAKNLLMDMRKSRSDRFGLVLLQADASAPVGATVPATLALTLGAPASFGAFMPGVERVYTSATTATVVSTAGDAALSFSEPGRLVNGAFSLAQPLQVELGRAAWTGPVSNEIVPVTFKQPIGAGEALRTGGYARTLTFTLSTTAP